MIRRRVKAKLPWKPVFPKTRRELARTALRTERPEVREATYDLDHGRCFWPTCQKAVALGAAHIHEVVWRSLGGSPVDTEITVTLCGRCHAHIHPRVGGLLKRITGTRTEGFTCEEKQPDGTWLEVC